MSHEFGEVRQDSIMKGLVGLAKAFGLHPKERGVLKGSK